MARETKSFLSSLLITIAESFDDSLYLHHTLIARQVHLHSGSGCQKATFEAK